MTLNYPTLAATALLCCGGLLFSPTSLHAADTAPSGTASVQLPQSRQWTMTATGSGRQYEIFVAEPDGPAPEGGYATIYVLDGNSMFFTTAEAVRAYSRRRDGAEDIRAIVVGIGYPDGADIAAERTFDLTSVQDAESPVPTGGAEAFFRFIQDDLRPRIERDYPVDPRQQALMGHSFGGLFTIDTLARHPDAFQAYVGMSSSFWFGNHDLSRRIAAFAQERASEPTDVRVLLTTGEFEQRPRPEKWAEHPRRASAAARGLEARGQQTRAREAARQLAQVPGLIVDYREIAGEDHGTVIPGAIARGVDFILNGPRSVPPVPSAEEYLALGPEGRYRLRMQVRALPDPHRIPWLNGLKASLESGLDKEGHQALHEERVQMDETFGSRPHEVNAD